MKNDFDETLLIGYLHRALTEAEQAQVEQRLKTDTAYRAQLAALRQLHEVVKGGVSAEIQAQTPPATMTFDAIAPQLRKRPRQSWRTRWVSNLTAIAALFVLISAMMFSLGESTDSTNRSIQEGSGGVATITPTVAALIEVTPLPASTTNDVSTLPTRTPLPEDIGEPIEDGVNSIPTRTPSP